MDTKELLAWHVVLVPGASYTTSHLGGRAMGDLVKFITDNARRGECNCGRCADRLHGPEEYLGEHTVSVGFFAVALANPDNPPDVGELLKLTREHVHAFGGDCDPLDGEMHCFIELGGWIGDQGLALMFIALGGLLGAWGVWDPGGRPIMSTRKELLAIMSGVPA